MADSKDYLRNVLLAGATAAGAAGIATATAGEAEAQVRRTQPRQTQTQTPAQRRVAPQQETQRGLSDFDRAVNNITSQLEARRDYRLGLEEIDRQYEDDLASKPRYSTAPSREEQGARTQPEGNLPRKGNVLAQVLGTVGDVVLDGEAGNASGRVARREEAATRRREEAINRRNRRQEQRSETERNRDQREEYRAAQQAESRAVRATNKLENAFQRRMFTLTRELDQLKQVLPLETLNKAADKALQVFEGRYGPISGLLPEELDREASRILDRAKRNIVASTEKENGAPGTELSKDVKGKFTLTVYEREKSAENKGQQRG